MSSLPDRLRQETRSQHEQMESVFALPRSREELRNWVARFLGFLEPLEQAAVARLGADHPALAQRLKSGWLRDDLQALGLDAAAVAALPRATLPAGLDAMPRLLGALYVFEGATLGGQLISKHLEQTLGLSGGAGYRYFRSYGAEAGRRWQEFRALLLQHSSPAADDQIVAGANDTFSALRVWCTAAS